MNEIRRPDSVDEISRIREIVARHDLPSFVTGFKVELGNYDGEPAMWVTFERVGDRDLDIEALRARAREMNDFTTLVQDNLIREIDARFPFFRSISAETRGAQAA